MAWITEEAIDKLLEAGRIAYKALNYGAGLIKPGASARDVCVKVENYIVELGARPAFPCNFSVDYVAAHYTPGIRDDVSVGEESVVKIDVGVSLDGYIADTALTVDLSGRHENLLAASREALEEVTKRIRPGISLYEIGKIVEATVKKKGLRVIRNLTGHTIARYTIHAGLSIPNYPDRTTFYKRLQPGMQVAIEPFATNGRGLVQEGSTVNIYAYTGRKPRRPLNDVEKEILEEIIARYNTLPFTPRWLLDKYDPDEVEKTVKTLTLKGVLHDYPILVEAGKGLVSQHEHTFIILKDGVIITTCPTCNE